MSFTIRLKNHLKSSLLTNEFLTNQIAKKCIRVILWLGNTSVGQLEFFVLEQHIRLTTLSVTYFKRT